MIANSKIANTRNVIYLQECPEKLMAKMKCITPEIEVPPKFEHILITNVDVDKTPVYRVDDETLTFYAGVVFDGFD